MDAEFTYSIEAAADLPEVATDFIGVTIQCPERVSVDGQWTLSGFFQLPMAELEAIDEQPHRALVVVATLGGSWYVDSPLRQKIFFPDDLHAAGDLVRGYFSFELFSLFRDRVPGAYRIMVSLGERLSESLPTEVG